ncbi:MAG: glycosyltransferase [Candidatus Sedimenticola sp. PURPLELP]
MKISVLMPCYNAEKFIRRSIESVLSQHSPEFELVIVDDGSIDNTAAIIAGYQDSRIRLLRLESNSGIVTALNAGLKVCRGSYIARMDADDICLEGRLAQQSDYLDSHADVVAVGSAVVNFNEAGHLVEIGYPTDHSNILLHLLLFERTLCHPSVMFRANVIEAGVRYQEKRSLCEDYDLWFQLSKIGRLANIERPLLKYFRGGTQSSVQHRALMLKQTRALLCHIWQQYEIDNIDLIVDYLMAQMDMSRQQREAARSAIIRSLSRLPHFTAVQVNEVLALKELRFCHRYKSGIARLFALNNYLWSVRKGRCRKVLFLWKVRSIARLGPDAL